MKKILASVLAAAMALSMSSVAFAWGDPATGNKPTVGGTVINPGAPSYSEKDTILIPIYVSNNEPSGLYKGDIDISAKAKGFPIYTYGPDDSVTLNIIAYGNSSAVNDVYGKITKVSARSSNTQVTASVKRNTGLYNSIKKTGNTNFATDSALVGAPTTIKIKAITKGTDFKYDDDLNDMAIDLDVTVQPIQPDGTNYGSKLETTVTVKFDASIAYSKTQELLNDEDITLSKANGTIVKFSDVIYDKTRVRAGDNLDIFFKGNYGTNKQNLRVVTDSIDAITTYFEDTNVNVYNFPFNPKFASSVKVAIDCDPNSTVYSYNEKTGDVKKIATAYENSQATFEAKNLNCFIVSDEEYEDGNVKGGSDDTIVEEGPDGPEEEEIIDTPRKNPNSGGL